MSMRGVPAAVGGRWACRGQASPSAAHGHSDPLVWPGQAPAPPPPPRSGVGMRKQPRPQPGATHHHRRGQWVASSAHGRWGGRRPVISQHWSRAGVSLHYSNNAAPLHTTPGSKLLTPPLSTQRPVTGPCAQPGVESLPPGRSPASSQAPSSTWAGFPFHRVKSQTAPASRGRED